MTKSLNFWTTIVTIVITALFTSQGVQIDFTAQQLAELILTEQGIGLAVSLFMLLYTPLFKTWTRIKTEGYDWRALKSRNLVAHLLSLIGIVLGLWLGAEQVGFAIALVTQIVNFLMHRFNFGA